jgi:hypothetical protein
MQKLLKLALSYREVIKKLILLFCYSKMNDWVLLGAKVNSEKSQDIGYLGKSESIIYI